MINRLRHIISRLWAALLSTVALFPLGACASGEDVPVVPGGDEPGVAVEYTMGLYISLGDKTVSRATPTDGEYDPGAGYENYIDLTGETPDMRLYLFDTADRYIGSLIDPEIVPVSESPGSKTYQLTFNVDKTFAEKYSGGSFKLVMLANWGRVYPSAPVAGVTTIDDLVKSAEAVKAYTPSPAVLTATDLIPMFGVVQFNNVILDPKVLVMLPETLHLLRAYAKVEVYDADNSKDFISSVSLTRHSSRAYMAPHGVTHQDDYVKHKYDDDYVSTLTIPASSVNADPVTVRRAPSGSFIIYVPEFRNIGVSADERARLYVTYKDGNSFYVDFKYYNDPPAGFTKGDPFDIRRNYWYKFAVNRQDFELIMSVDVMPYGEVILEPSFGID